MLSELNELHSGLSGWLSRYALVEKGLAKQSNLTSREIISLVKGVLQSDPSLAQMMCLFAVLSTTEGLPGDYYSWTGGMGMGGMMMGGMMGMGFSSPVVSYGSGGWSRDDTMKVIHKAIKAFVTVDYELVKSLSVSNITSILHGIRFIWSKGQWFDDYLWVRMVPFVFILCQNTSGVRSISFVEPEVNKYHMAPKAYKEIIQSLSVSDDLLADPLPDTIHRFPIVSVLISQAPNLRVLVEFSSYVPHDNEPVMQVWRRTLIERLRTYRWNNYGKNGNEDVDCCINLLKTLHITDVLTVLENNFANTDFDSLEVHEVLPLLTYSINIYKEAYGTPEEMTKLQEKFGGVGRSVTQWILRKYQDAKVSLTDIISRLNKFIKQTSLDYYQSYFAAALKKLLSIPDDKQILIKELKVARFEDWEDVVVQIFTDRAIQSVESLSTNEERQIKVFTILSKLKSKNVAAMRLALLTRLLSFSCASNPTLANIISSSGLWILFMEFVGEMGINLKSQEQKPELVEMVTHINQAGLIIDKVVHGVIDGSCTLGDLDIVLTNVSRTRDVVKVFLGPIHAFNDDLITKRDHQLKVFSDKVTHLQCFINIFCSPVGVDSDDMGGLASRLIHIRKEWNTLILKDVCTKFDDLSVLPYLRWLYSLQGSEIFLSYWKKLGNSKEFKMLAIQPLKIFGDAVTSALKLGIPPNENLIEILVNQLLEGKFHDKARAAVGAMARGNPPPAPGPMRPIQPIPPAAVQPVPAPVPAAQPPPFNIVENGPVLMDSVVVLLIPAAFLMWSALFSSVHQNRITFLQLETTFSLMSKRRIETEIGCLWQTGQGDPTLVNPRHEEWISSRFNLVLNYRLLAAHKRRISGLLNLSKIWGPLFQHVDFSEDQLYQKLLSTDITFQKEWDTQNLSNVSKFIDVKHIFDIFSKNHLLFLDELSKSEELLRWLFQQKSTEEFSQLISITKSNTDDAIALRAIASLQSTRNRLSNLLYPPKKFSDLQEFILEFSRVEIPDKDIVVQLSTANEKFEFLTKIFAEKTRSPGMQACYDLKDILAAGQFVFRSLGKQDNTQPGLLAGLSLEYKTEKKPISADGLIDLRNRLMLAKIPKELQIENISALIANFIEQLKVLLEVSSLLSSLKDVGHFSYLSYQEKFSPHSSVGDLRAREAFFKQELESWNELVSHMRDQYYFLNYFSMNQIIKLLDCLDKGEEAVTDIYSSLKSVNTQLVVGQVSVKSWEKSAEGEKPERRLERLALFLSQVLGDIPPVSRPTKNIVTRMSSNMI